MQNGFSLVPPLSLYLLQSAVMWVSPHGFPALASRRCRRRRSWSIGWNNWNEKFDNFGMKSGALRNTRAGDNLEMTGMPRIDVVNESTSITDAEIQAMLPAFESQWNNDLRPVWNVIAANFAFTTRTAAAQASSWWLVFLDDSDQAGALAYHDLTPQGKPISKVFVKTLLADNASVSVGATHELCEMAVDPWLNSAYQDSKATFWAGEVCDPVEDDLYGYDINGVLVSDFVYPSWFGHQFDSGPYDHTGHVLSAFEVLSGGYAQKWGPRAGWEQVTGSAVKPGRKEAAVGSRRDRRINSWGSWERSLPRAPTK